MNAGEQREPSGEFERRFARIESLLAQLSASADPELERVTREVLATVLELHQRGLSRLLELCAAGEQLREALARDPRVGPMLLLHDLHPFALDARVSRAVADLRPSLQGKLAEVTVDVQDGMVKVCVVPAASACASTRAEFKKDFEEALLSAAPDARSIVVELAEPAPALVTLRLQRGTAKQGAPDGPR